MADSPGKWMRSLTLPDTVRPDSLKAAANGTRAVAEDRILESKRTIPVVPTERTQVFTG